MTAATATLLVSCRDRTGLIAALSEFVARHNGNIVDADQHAEHDSGLFFMRLVWELTGFTLDREALRVAVAQLAERFDLRWELSFSDVRPRVAVFVSKMPHCLYDLLLCHQLGELNGEIVTVVSNHDALATVCRHFEIPFQHVNVEAANKEAAEAQQQTLLDDLGVG